MVIIEALAKTEPSVAVSSLSLSNDTSCSVLDLPQYTGTKYQYAGIGVATVFSGSPLVCQTRWARLGLFPQQPAFRSWHLNSYMLYLNAIQRFLGSLDFFVIMAPYFDIRQI